MTSQNEPSTNKRQRGRPKGSAPRKQADLKLLRRLAKELARHPDLNVTKVFRRYGVQGESNLARLRKRWREEGPSLLDAARIDLHHRESGGTFSKALLLFDDFAVRVHEVLEAVPLGDILRRAQTHHDVQQAKRRQGSSRDVALDTTNPEDLIAAIGRLEARDPDVEKRIIEAEGQGVDLSDWQHQYVMAIVLHEMALEGWKREQEACADNG